MGLKQNKIQRINCFNSNKSIALIIISVLLLSMVAFLWIPQAKATTLFSDTFASGDFTAWSGTSGIVLELISSTPTPVPTPPVTTPVPTTNPGTENLSYPTPTPTLNPTINPQPSPIVQIIKQLTGNQSSTTYIIVVVIIIGVIAFGLYVSNSNSDSKLKRKMQKQSDWKNPLG
jgi:preprotein translocase subunit YajC